METPAIAGCSKLLVAAAGAVGALAGLLFVSLSINPALGGFIPGGIARFAVGVILLMLAAVLNAWVLLVEILR
jgi:hypothetical protein